MSKNTPPITRSFVIESVIPPWEHRASWLDASRAVVNARMTLEDERVIPVIIDLPAEVPLRANAGEAVELPMRRQQVGGLSYLERWPEYRNVYRAEP